MNESITIYHNPRCSKSRQTLALLQERGIEPQVIPYLDQPPSKATLTGLLGQLGLAPRELMRKGEARYKALGLDDPGLSEDQLIQAMVDNPILIERPIVVSAKGAALGRPPQSVLEIL